MLKLDEGNFWLYPKLLLTGLFCFVVTAALNPWPPDSQAIGLGLIPFLAVITYSGRPLSYKQWLIRIVVLEIAVALFKIFVSIVK
jgi:hypothetical protein